MAMTIYDIAEEAGVSASTVSRVITGNNKVKKETRDKVNAILEKHNFVPDQNARGLVNGSSKLIGIILEDIRIGHHTSITYEVERKLYEIGYCGIILNSSSDIVHIKNCIDILANRKVEAIILVGSIYQNEEIVKYIDKNFKNPTILVNGYAEAKNLWNIVIDELGGVSKCVELLKNKGKNKIAYVQKPTTASGERKKKGYIDKMVELGCKESDLIIIDSPKPTVEDGYLGTMKALFRNKDIDAIIYSEDLIAVGGIKAILDTGRKVPEDVSVIGINNSIYCEVVTPRLTSLNTALNELGRVSVNLLVDVLNGKNPQKTTVIDLDIEVRETT